MWFVLIVLGFFESVLFDMGYLFSLKQSSIPKSYAIVVLWFVLIVSGLFEYKYGILIFSLQPQIFCYSCLWFVSRQKLIFFGMTSNVTARVVCGLC